MSSFPATSSAQSLTPILSAVSHSDVSTLPRPPSTNSVIRIKPPPSPGVGMVASPPNQCVARPPSLAPPTRKILPAPSPPIIRVGGSALAFHGKTITPVIRSVTPNQSKVTISHLSLIGLKPNKTEDSKVSVIDLTKDVPKDVEGVRVNPVLPSTPVILHTPKIVSNSITQVKRPIITLTVPKISSTTSGTCKKDVVVSSSSFSPTNSSDTPKISCPPSLKGTNTMPTPTTSTSANSVQTSACKTTVASSGPTTTTSTNVSQHGQHADAAETATVESAPEECGAPPAGLPSEQSYTLSIAEDECITVRSCNATDRLEALDKSNIASIIKQFAEVAEGRDGKSSGTEGAKEDNEGHCKSKEEKITTDCPADIHSKTSHKENICDENQVLSDAKSNEDINKGHCNVKSCDSKDINLEDEDSLCCTEDINEALSAENSPPKLGNIKFSEVLPLNNDLDVADLVGSKFKFKLNEHNILEMVDGEELGKKVKRPLEFSDNEENIKELKRAKPCFLDLLSKCGGPDYRNADLAQCEERENVQAFEQIGGEACSTEDRENDEVTVAPNTLACQENPIKGPNKQCEVIDLCESQMETNDDKENHFGKSGFNRREEDILKPLWLDNRQQFSWVKYLEHCQRDEAEGKAAPLRLFSDPFPSTKNLFHPGMKLEAIDPQHQSLFCVMTVVDVMGYRVKLHFDGYSDVHDFWINANSKNIFPVGWCQKNNKTLLPPPGTMRFSWQAYLEHCKCNAAPRSAFSTSSSAVSASITSGMKLEAEDRKNGWMCVATIKDVMDHRLLVHFDGWGDSYDFWTEISSPYVRPIGWCNSNNVNLYPPKDYPNAESFNWYEYLQECNATAVPARAFKTRSPLGFKRNMKLEVVDKRNPMLIRVATVVDVQDYQIKIHFDGWSGAYDFWVDDDSPDIHPPTWCSKTGHPLQPPVTPHQPSDEKNCGVYGCKGYGHVKGPIFTTHHTAFGCPYSAQNLHKDPDFLIPDRIIAEPDKRARKSNSKSLLLDLGHGLPEDEDSLKKRVRKRRRFFDEICDAKTKCPKLSAEEESGKFFPSSQLGKEESKESRVPSTPKELSVDAQIHQSVFCSTGSIPLIHPLHNWRNLKHLFLPLEDVDRDKMLLWTPHEVEARLQQVAGCGDIRGQFVSELIDGEALLLLTQEDLIKGLKLKLGQALKIMAFVNSMR